MSLDFRFTIFLLGILLLGSNLGSARATTLSGAVRDPNGAALVAARVTLLSPVKELFVNHYLRGTEGQCGRPDIGRTRRLFRDFLKQESGPAFCVDSHHAGFSASFHSWLLAFVGTPRRLGSSVRTVARNQRFKE
jgi:hypothetical protein